jgi:hypothetical protein
MVKIGFAISDVPGRIDALQPGCWETLHLLRVVHPGPKLAESWFHRRFADNRVARDWFRFDPEMLTVEPPTLADLIAAASHVEAGPSMQLIRSRHGMQAKIARALGCSRQALQFWDKVPAEYLPTVEQVSGIPRHLLRPDICLPPATAPATTSEPAA